MEKQENTQYWTVQVKDHIHMLCINTHAQHGRVFDFEGGDVKFGSVEGPWWLDGSVECAKPQWRSLGIRV